ncbi:MAG: hypothetical protein WHS88_09600 [Anaerohalosphaeraceae bacterium]
MMAFLAGIDEAGYGPLLGPLVAATAVFEVPDALLRADLWKVLESAVSRQKKGQRGRLLINDSKKVYSRQAGLKDLLRSVLASLLAGGLESVPQTTEEVLNVLCPDFAHQRGEYPWHTRPTEKVSIDPADIRIAGALFRRVLEEQGMRFCFLQARCLEVAEYNRQIGLVKNKARVLFGQLCCLIDTVFQKSRSSGKVVQFLIDRQGGRLRYRSELQRMFPQMELTILKESDELSSYQLRSEEGTMRLHFTAGADEKYLPVSLASMAAKLVRELMMDNINAYFSEICGQIRPTAGYWQDGQRYLLELTKYLGESGVDKRLLVRVR